MNLIPIYLKGSEFKLGLLRAQIVAVQLFAMLYNSCTLIVVSFDNTIFKAKIDTNLLMKIHQILPIQAHQKLTE